MIIAIVRIDKTGSGIDVAAAIDAKSAIPTRAATALILEITEGNCSICVVDIMDLIAAINSGVIPHDAIN